MVKSLYVMSDTHDDLEATARAVDYALSEGKEGSRIVHVGDLSLRPYARDSLDKLKSSDAFKAFLANTTPQNAQAQLENLVSSGAFRTFAVEKRIHNNRVLNDYKLLLEESEMPFTVIPGNYDGQLGEIFGENDIHNRSVAFGNAKVVGYGAGGNQDDSWIGPMHIRLLAQTGQIALFRPNELKKLLESNNPDIAVIHNPPYGFCDDMFNGEHVGTPTTTRHMQQNNNLKLVLSGHIHEAGPNGNNPNGVKGVRGIQREDGSKVIVVNPGNLGRFELIDHQTLETAREFPYGTFARVDIEEDGAPVRVKQYGVQESGRQIGQVREIGDFDLTA